VKPVPTSNKGHTPLDFMLPVVGLVILESIFNKVDFPAPFLPIMPSTLLVALKLMSFNAQT
jgi:hypothetical protein